MVTVALYCLLTVSCNVFADGADSAPQTSDATTAELNAATPSNAGILSFLVPGMAWPLTGSLLVLAAINSRKRKPGQTARTSQLPD